MEKVIYLVWSGAGADVLAAAPRLIAAGGTGVQVNVGDADVLPAAHQKIESNPPAPDAIVSVWVPSATDHLRAPFDAIVRDATGAAGEIAAYLVTESVPLANTRYPAEPGERTEGLAQVAFLRRPDGMADADFLDRWLNGHTQLAIDVQDTFVYVQNVVARTLIAHGVPCDGIVEECFPTAAMTDIHAFFDAVDDDDRLNDHLTKMMNSTGRFLALDRIDVIPTSRYAF